MSKGTKCWSTTKAFPKGLTYVDNGIYWERGPLFHDV